MTNVKITVFKRVDPSVIFDGNVPNRPGMDEPITKGTAFEQGQVYISEDSARSDGFCNWVWRDISKDVAILNFGGNFWKDRMRAGEMLTCCTRSRQYDSS